MVTRLPSTCVFAWRLSALMMPEVADCSRPSGLPIATAYSPTCTVLESPTAVGFRLLALIFSTARSSVGASPTRRAEICRPLASSTVNEESPRTTWSLVTR